MGQAPLGEDLWRLCKEHPAPPTPVTASAGFTPCGLFEEKSQGAIK